MITKTNKIINNRVENIMIKSLNNNKILNIQIKKILNYKKRI